MLWEWSIDASSERVQLRWAASRRPACVTDVQYLFLCDRTHMYHTYKYSNIKLCIHSCEFGLSGYIDLFLLLGRLLQCECEFYCRESIVSLSPRFDMMSNNYVRRFESCFYQVVVTCNDGPVLAYYISNCTLASTVILLSWELLTVHIMHLSVLLRMLVL